MSTLQITLVCDDLKRLTVFEHDCTRTTYGENVLSREACAKVNNSQHSKYGKWTVLTSLWMS